MAIQVKWRDNQKVLDSLTHLHINNVSLSFLTKNLFDMFEVSGDLERSREEGEMKLFLDRKINRCNYCSKHSRVKNTSENKYLQFYVAFQE